MCRRNQVLGFVLIGFGIGVLVGLWLESGFLAHCLGAAAIVVGCGITKRK